MKNDTRTFGSPWLCATGLKSRAPRVALLLCAVTLDLVIGCGGELPEERLGRALAKAKAALRQCREKVSIPSLEEFREPLRSQVKAALATYDFLGLSEEDKLQVLRAHLDGEVATDFDALPKREQHKVIDGVTGTYRSLVRQHCSTELDELEAAIEARDLYLRSGRRSDRGSRPEDARDLIAERHLEPVNGAGFDISTHNTTLQWTGPRADRPGR